MKFNTLIDQLNKKEIAPIYLVLGKEPYQRTKIHNAFLDLIPETEHDFNIGQYDMETTPLSEAINDASSAPFFGNWRVVFIDDPYFLTAETKHSKIKHEIDELINYIKKPLNTTILVICAPYDKLDGRKKITKLLKQTAVLVESNPLSESEVRFEIQTVLRQQHYQIEPRALDVLVERTGANLNIAMNEVEKLKLAAHADHLITLSEVKQLVSLSLEQNIFDLVDVVLNHQVSVALEMYHNLILQKEEPLKINAILIGQFRLLLQVKILRKNHYGLNDIVNTLKVHPYRAQLALRKVDHFKLKDLKQGYLGLVANELKMKSTTTDPELLFQLFLLKFTGLKK